MKKMPQKSCRCTSIVAINGKVAALTYIQNNKAVQWILVLPVRTLTHTVAELVAGETVLFACLVVN